MLPIFLFINHSSININIKYQKTWREAGKLIFYWNNPKKMHGHIKVPEPPQHAIAILRSAQYCQWNKAVWWSINEYCSCYAITISLSYCTRVLRCDVMEYERTLSVRCRCSYSEYTTVVSSLWLNSFDSQLVPPHAPLNEKAINWSTNKRNNDKSQKATTA